MRNFVAGLALFAIACGGSEAAEDHGDEAAASSTPAATAAAPASAEGTGTVHEVQMVLQDGAYKFIPENLTIKVGDTVRWTNVSGGPHNVRFYDDQVPEGAHEVLNNIMPNRIGDLNGQMLTAPNATYEVVFAGAPTGEYGYVCLPHEPMGMTGTLVIEE